MSRIDDVRKTIETTLGTLTPTKAQQLARGLLEPGARKEQVAKTAGELLDWSQRNRQRIRDLVRREIRDQLEQVGVATRADLDGLKKRVRQLERDAARTGTVKGSRARESSGERRKAALARRTPPGEATGRAAAAAAKRSAGSATGAKRSAAAAKGSSSAAKRSRSASKTSTSATGRSSASSGPSSANPSGSA